MKAESSASGSPSLRPVRGGSLALRRAVRGFSRLIVGVVILALSAVGFAGAATSLPLTAAASLHHGKGPLSRFDAWAEQGALHLPPSTEAPAPPPADLGPPLRPHELFGFAPYWTLAQSATFDVARLSTVAYFGADCSPDGSLLGSGSGWTGLQSEALTQLITRTHRAGNRVVLTVKCFDNGVIHGIVSDPGAVLRLEVGLVQALQARSLDGVNVDFESTDGSDRAAFTQLISGLAAVLHATNRQWQVTVDTYGSSAGDPSNIFDVGALAPVVDGLFVMAYDMNHSGGPGPTAPLAGYPSNDTAVVAAYTSSAPASKVILGTPFYGYDWVTSGAALGSPAAGDPTPQTYAQISSAGHPAYWDAQGSVPWTAYQDGQQQWHQTWYDNPLSLALKARLAERAQLAGLGIWALGMEGGDPAMMAALTGAAGPLAAALHEQGSGPPPSPPAAGPVSPLPSTTTAPGSAPPRPGEVASPAGPPPPAPPPPARSNPPGSGQAPSPPPPAPTPSPTPSPTPAPGSGLPSLPPLP